ncbi:hypothetical protein [Yersinia kristensenii]|uniref:hypothetical protein n=1 Tax=Yersinia kristensenii TaxID=28152 RepID=UPI0011A07976|nr:hypothetical protein [Yersinia kristensenii]
MLSKEQLEKRIAEIRKTPGAVIWPTCDRVQLSLNEAEALEELLSLREQLEALKVWATNRAIGDDALENENYTSIKVDWRQRQLNDLLNNEKHSIFIAVQEALSTADKPSED